jgi:flagellin
LNTSSVVQTVNLEIQGNLGVTTLQFVSGTAASAMVEAINTISDATGVEASFVNTANTNSGLVLSSRFLGSRQFVSVQTLPGGGTFSLADLNGDPSQRDSGRDAVATINGALTLGDGNNLTLKTSTLAMELELDASFGLGTTSFAITGGGALFQVGPEVNTNLQVNIGVQSVAASRLGNSEIGFLSQIQAGGDFSLLKGEYQQAQLIVKEAIRQVAVLRGRLGAFEKNTLDTNINQLGITMENLMAAESMIRDADFAFETSQMARAQVLVSAGISVVGISNQTPQAVLSLLG